MCVLLCPWGWILWALLTSAKLLPVSFKPKNEAKILNRLCNPTYFNILYLNKLCLRQAMQIQRNQRNRALRFGLDWIQRLKYCLCLRESDREYVGVLDNSSSQTYVVPLDWAEPSPAIISTSKICHIDKGWHVWSNISPGFSSKSNSFNSFSRFFFASISLFSVTSVRTFKVHSSRFFVTRVTSASHAGVERSSWIKHYALPPPKQPPSVGSISVSLSSCP